MPAPGLRLELEIALLYYDHLNFSESQELKSILDQDNSPWILKLSTGKRAIGINIITNSQDIPQDGLDYHSTALHQQSPTSWWEKVSLEALSGHHQPASSESSTTQGRIGFVRK